MGDGFVGLRPEVRVGWFGALFAMAAADGDSAREELLTILDRLDSAGLPAEDWLKVRRYMADAPELQASLKVLVGEPPAVRYGTFIHLLDVAWADGNMAPEERERLKSAGVTLKIPADQIPQLEASIKAVHDEYDGDITCDEALAAFTAAGAPEDVILE